MRAQIEEVLRLQRGWTWENTPDMERRGVLVRRDAPNWLREHLPELSKLVPQAVDDLSVEGRDGTGRKTEVPWVRVYSTSRSPSATVGFYVVYLFSGSGSHAYVSLNQGTTRWENGDFRETRSRAGGAGQLGARGHRRCPFQASGPPCPD